MSLARVVVTAVIVEGRSKTQVARDYGVARSWVYKLLKRFETGGEDVFEPRSRKPQSDSRATPGEVEDCVLWWRESLSEQRLDVWRHHTEKPFGHSKTQRSKTVEKEKKSYLRILR